MKLIIASAAALLIIAGAAHASDFHASLDGFQQVPSVFTEGKGAFDAELDKNGDSLSYTLTWSNLTAAPTVAHIHFGQARTNGGVIAFLCGGGGKPACSDGTVSSTITSADVVGPAVQGIQPGNFDALLDALRARAAYANVHTPTFPDGEIRGQIRGKGGE